jgi:hypothetical protein
MIALAFIHLIFPKYFNWKEDLNSLSLINRQMMYVHTFFIALVVLLMGVLCLTSTIDILNTSLGKQIALGFALFWFLRLVVQFFGYSSKLWKGKKFETFVHLVFAMLWAYFTFVFIFIYSR